MNYIIEIDRITCEDKCLIYIGIEYKTGKIRYLIHYNDDTLFEIYNPKYFEIYNLSYKRWYSDKLPSELKSLLDKQIQNHKKFNLDNNLPIDMLEYNQKYLSTQYDWHLNIFGSIATYTPLENKIHLNITSDNWEGLDEIKKREYNYILLHEIGHMKASQMIIDENMFQVHTKTGFDTSIYQFQPLFLKNGDVFLMFEKLLSSTNKYEILEEMMNEFECQLIYPNYVPVYPCFAKQINELCDGKLLLARYTNGIEEYYSCMNKIINSKDLSDELLERILDFNNGDEVDNENNKTKVLNIINQYKKIKNISLY